MLQAGPSSDEHPLDLLAIGHPNSTHGSALKVGRTWALQNVKTVSYRESLNLPKLFPLWIPFTTEEIWCLLGFAGMHHEMLHRMRQHYIHWIGRHYIKQYMCEDTSILINKLTKCASSCSQSSRLSDKVSLCIIQLILPPKQCVTIQTACWERSPAC